MKEMHVRVVTPDKLIFDGQATRIQVKGTEGQFMVLPRHLPMVSLLGLGELRIDSPHDAESHYIAIDEGVLEVSNNKITILATDALAAEDIDVARLRMDLEREERHKQNLKSRDEMLRQELEINKLLNKLRVGERRR
ncbi:MAG: ATP synthase F1 subunit epsilon [Turicibacter sp.]|nr:ATP synthase F1 subunit epsilon [Turicibacter sp.]